MRHAAHTTPGAVLAAMYLSGSKILGRYGNGSEVRAGLNWYVVKERGVRIKAQWIHLNKCPVGYSSVPYPVGGQRQHLPHGHRDEFLMQAHAMTRAPALANILCYPTSNIFLGPEVQWGKRENFKDGFTSDDVRIQFSAKYGLGRRSLWKT